MEEHDPTQLPSERGLASVSLLPRDWINPTGGGECHGYWMHVVLWNADVETMSTQQLLTYFTREEPAAIQSERGARFNALRREAQDTTMKGPKAP